MTTILDGDITLTYTEHEFNQLLTTGEVSLYKKDKDSLFFYGRDDNHTVWGYELTGKTTKTRTQYKLWYQYKTSPMFDTIWVKQ